MAKSFVGKSFIDLEGLSSFWTKAKSYYVTGDHKGAVVDRAWGDDLGDQISKKYAVATEVTGALGGKVDKVPGSQLVPTVDYEKLQGIAAGAQVNKLEAIDVTMPGAAPAPQEIKAGKKITIDLSSLATQKYVGEKIAEQVHFKAQIVEGDLPPVGTDGTIYLKKASTEDDSHYDEFMYVNKAWERIGSTRTSLKGYATETFVKEAVNTAKTALTQTIEANKTAADATATALGKLGEASSTTAFGKIKSLETTVDGLVSTGGEKNVIEKITITGRAEGAVEAVVDADKKTATIDLAHLYTAVNANTSGLATANNGLTQAKKDIETNATKIGTVESNLNSEIARAKAAEGVNAAAIAQEVEDRGKAVTAVDGKITAEVTARGEDDDALYEAIKAVSSEAIINKCFPGAAATLMI